MAIKTISNTIKILIKFIIYQFIYIVNNFFKYKNKIMNYLLDLSNSKDTFLEKKKLL